MKDKKNPAVARKKKREGKFYVYIYTNPNTRKVLYVGKGTGKRALAHMKEPDNEALKEKIQTLRSKGVEPRIEVLCGKMTQSDALAAEAAVIEFVGKNKLGNVVSGHTHGYGRMPFRQYLDLVQGKGKEAKITHDALLLNVNQKFSHNMVRDDRTTTAGLRKITCAEWAMSKKAKKAEYAFAIYRGIVYEVYHIRKWRDCARVNGRSRLAFSGKVAPEKIRKQYVGKFVPGKKGAQNPVRYSWKMPEKNARKAWRG